MKVNAEHLAALDKAAEDRGISRGGLVELLVERAGLLPPSKWLHRSKTQAQRDVAPQFKHGIG